MFTVEEQTSFKGGWVFVVDLRCLIAGGLALLFPFVVFSYSFFNDKDSLVLLKRNKHT